MEANNIENAAQTNVIQQLGSFLSKMIMPNIGAFIAWGLFIILFGEAGWFPNENIAAMVDPMLRFLLPLLIGYTGGELIYGKRGGVVGAIATMGVIMGAEIPMFIGAMIMGPLGSNAIKTWDSFVSGKVKDGFELLVDNFSSGITGFLLALIGFFAVGPLVTVLTELVTAGISWIMQTGLLPLANVLIEPAKVLFLNSAINHGILTPIGIEQSADIGKSILFLLETNPGPGLGILLAYIFFGEGTSKSTAPGAALIHFFGGVHEIYFPYIMMKPSLILAAIVGGVSGTFINMVFNSGLVAAASPGSIITILAMTPKGDYAGVLLSVLVSTLSSFCVSAFILKWDRVPSAVFTERIRRNG